MNSKNNTNLKEEEDFLKVDNPIPGQNFVCMSFVSPEKTLKQKQTYFTHNFLKSVSKKYDLSEETIEDAYDTYVYNNSDQLEKDFYEKNDFNTSVRGLKIRGTYDTRREAEVRAKVLQRQDPNFHVFVGQVGYWLPWDPEADNIEDQEYTESSLNKLVKKYQENKKKKDVFFEQQKQDNIKHINSENEKNNVNNQTKELENLEKEFSSVLEGEDPWLKNKSLEKTDIIEESNEDDGKFLDLDSDISSSSSSNQ